MLANIIRYIGFNPATNLKRAACFAVIMSLLSACNSTGTTSMGLEDTQQQQLGEIEIKVRQEASLLRAMSRVDVEDMLKAHDEEVRRILNATQWLAYEEQYREELSSQIFMTIDSQRQSLKRRQRQ